MVKTLNFYLDESGPRRPDQRVDKLPKHGNDWFALGGVLVKDEDEDTVRRAHAEFLSRWTISAPLHSSEIRNRADNFLWLQELKVAQPDRFDQFNDDLRQFLGALPVLGLACVIDRPGYNRRYEEMYGAQRWRLCKSAFSMAVERAAKYARLIDRKLRVFPECCSKIDDGLLRDYFADLKSGGAPFSQATSSKYDPLSPVEFAETLYELRFKRKSSPLAQLADLFLWPLCMGGYSPNNRAYSSLVEDGKLIETALPPETWATIGTKYFCFEGDPSRL
jgi:hypothetical protein